VWKNKKPEKKTEKVVEVKKEKKEIIRLCSVCEKQGH
jgi:hypothetical protein